jgi:hypothetical protein
MAATGCFDEMLRCDAATGAVTLMNSLQRGEGRAATKVNSLQWGPGQSDHDEANKDLTVIT